MGGGRSQVGRGLEGLGLVRRARRPELGLEVQTVGRSRQGAQILENRIEWKSANSAIN